MSLLYDDADNAELLYERDEGFGMGIDAFTRSTLLPPQTYTYGENILIPNEFDARTRPGADRLGDSFGNRIQGILYFDTPAVEQLIIGENTLMKYWNGTTWTAMAGYTLTDALINFSAAQGVDKMLITDGTKPLGIWDGAAFTIGGTSPIDPPQTATILLYHAGRMWAAGFPGGTNGKENDAIWGSALLQFGNGDWDGTQRNFRIGGGDGDPIRALASLTQSAQQGFVMAVLKANSIWFVNTDPTVTFSNFSAQLGPQMVSDGIGCVGKRAWCNFGNDLLFVSPDKSFRSLARMESAQSQYQISPPLSLPIQPYVDRINWAHADTICVVKYQDLALFSVPLDAALTPNTVFAYNGRLQKWVGIWTGWTPQGWEVTRFADVHRLVFGDQSGNVRQWKDFADASDDATYLDDGTAIPTKLWSRSYLFGSPVNNKDAFYFEARFSVSNAVPTITLIADNATVKSWTVDVQQTGPHLPIALDFYLTSDTNLPRRRGLRGLPPFNEAYWTIESTTGWWSLRNASMGSFLNTLSIA